MKLALAVSYRKRTRSEFGWPRKSDIAEPGIVTTSSSRGMGGESVAEAAADDPNASRRRTPPENTQSARLRICIVNMTTHSESLVPKIPRTGGEDEKFLK